MPTPPISRERFTDLLTRYKEIRGPERAWESVAKELGYKKGSSVKAALLSGSNLYRTGLPRRSYESMSIADRTRVEMEARGEVDRPTIATLPDLPSSDDPIDEILTTLARRSLTRVEAHDARQWAAIKLNVSGPYGLWFWGDPHLDDDGCAHHILQDHVRIVQANPYMLSVGMGDYQNNWVGRLARLYANQETSARTAWKLVEWWVNEVRPVLLLRGNHDAWQGAGDPLAWIAKDAGAMSADWQAKVQFVSPNGHVCRLWAAHDFPGSSMWNPLHSPQRKAVVSGARAHIYVAGHRHQWGAACHEDPESNHVYCLLRARGYKVLDDYAEQLGFGSQRYGHSVVVIVNPEADNPSQVVTPFACPETASDFLKFLRR